MDCLARFCVSGLSAEDLFGNPLSDRHLGWAAIGVGTGFLANQKAVKSFVVKGTFRWMQKSPGSFYAFFFLFMYQIMVLFGDLRYVVNAAIKTLLKLCAIKYF